MNNMQHNNTEAPVPYDIQSPDTVRTDILTAMPYAYHEKRGIDIEIRQPEFTSVCPMTGLPDYGSIIITYRPDRHIVELKSLKFYLLQYRNVGIFYEHVVNKILEDINRVITPERIVVKGEFTARGGITANITAAADTGTEGNDHELA
ncbi:MAG: preQ(1) synthase [Thermodesulfobacteriota bacterium]|nr:preQ(1) synthase [Thermodesulfobacteriota bacterium]